MISDKEIDQFCEEHKKLSFMKEKFYEAINVIVTCYKNGGKVLCCGNGGSSADSDHIVGELMKSFIIKRPVSNDFKSKAIKFFGSEGEEIAANLEQGLPAFSLTSQTALMTAFLNDCSSNYIFAQQVNTIGSSGDVFIGISTSGNSQNVILAAKTAKLKELKTICLLGRDGGELKKYSDINLISPEKETYKIQEDHLPIYHLLCACVEKEMFTVKE